MEIQTHKFNECVICYNLTSQRLTCCGNFMCGGCCKRWEMSQISSTTNKVTCPMCRHVWFEFMVNPTVDSWLFLFCGCGSRKIFIS